METRLQSNEVRIPKPEFDLKGSSGTATGPDLSSSSSSNNYNHYFKSSFARSLSSFGSSPQSKSLDYAINYGIHPQQQQRFSSIDEDGDSLLRYETNHSPFSMPPIYSTSTDFFEDEDAAAEAGKPATEQSTESLVSSSSTVKNVWTNAQVCLDSRPSIWTTLVSLVVLQFTQTVGEWANFQMLHQLPVFPSFSSPKLILLVALLLIYVYLLHMTARQQRERWNRKGKWIGNVLMRLFFFYF